jgi:hypothetical protein
MKYARHTENRSGGYADLRSDHAPRPSLAGFTAQVAAVRRAIPAVLGRSCPTLDWPFCARDLGSLIEGLAHGHGAALPSPGWAVSHGLAVVLTLAAAEVSGQRTGAVITPPAPTPRALPYQRARPGVPPDQGAVDYGQRPAVARN